MRRAFHDIYRFIGIVYCNILLLLCDTRDRVCKPRQKAVLIIAHPDDDSLFFYSYIKKEKPYVVLMTTGWSFIRLRSFRRAMHEYGVKFRAYDMTSRDVNVSLIEKRIKQILSMGNFDICVTHNADGEYGHMMHKQLHSAVLKSANCEVFVPVDAEHIMDYPLSDKEREEKIAFIKRNYPEEKWIITEYKIWIANEKLICVKE